MNEPDENSLEARRQWVKNLDALKDDNKRLKEWVETNDKEFTLLLLSARNLVSTGRYRVDGVLIDRDAFHALKDVLESLHRQTAGDVPANAGSAGSCHPSHGG